MQLSNDCRFRKELPAENARKLPFSVSCLVLFLINLKGVTSSRELLGARALLVVTSALLLVTSALLVVTSALLVVTSALLVVTSA